MPGGLVSSIRVLRALCLWSAVLVLTAAHAVDRPTRKELALGPMLRAVHMGGNWWTNSCFSDGNCPSSDMQSNIVPQEYVDHLNGVHANWIGISIALYVDNVSDATVDRKVAPNIISTWTDGQLHSLLQQFRDAGFNLYVTLAFEEPVENGDLSRSATCGTASYNAPRWQWGDTNAGDQDPCVATEHWRWDPDHPEHSSYVAEFWRSYTEHAVHFAEILEQEQVALYSLGTETEWLFRSRAGGGYPNQQPNHFKAELETMLAAVREVYNGLVTYDQFTDVLINDDFFGPGVKNLWKDIDFDAVGLSAYFPLASEAPSAVISHAELVDTWRDVFKNYLIPLQNRFPTKAIVFTEFGYSHSVEAPFNHSAEEFAPFIFTDVDGNGKDDGEESQENIYRAFFDVSRENPGVVKGAFLWGETMASEAGWANSYALQRSQAFRDRRAETVVRENYASPIPQPEYLPHAPTVIQIINSELLGDD